MVSHRVSKHREWNSYSQIEYLIRIHFWNNLMSQDIGPFLWTLFQFDMKWVHFSEREIVHRYILQIRYLHLVCSFQENGQFLLNCIKAHYNVLHIIICTAPIHFRNYSSFPKLLHIFVDVTPCYGQELPVVDSATGLEYNCGIYGVECPRSSFCHQTASFAKCCPKGRKSWNSFFASCEILLFL